MSLVHEQTADDITDDLKGVYDARDVDSGSPPPSKLKDALNAVVGQFIVEFLASNEKKPHVVFKLNLKTPIVKNQYHSVRLSMEVGDDKETEETGPGACQIKLCSYTGQTKSARAGFQFKIKTDTTVGELVNIILGRDDRLPAAMRADMRRFTFCVIKDMFDGCRDWIAQAFVRFHHLRLVSWNIINVFGEDGEPVTQEQLETRFAPEAPPPSVTRINWQAAGFHDVIGKYFNKPLAVRPGDIPVIRYRNLALENGKWWAPGFARVCQVSIAQNTTIIIPYRDPKPGTGDVSSKPPSHSGGGAVAGPSGTRTAPAPAGRGIPAPAPAGRGTPAPVTAGRGTPVPAPAGRGTPAPAPAGRGTPAPATAGRGTPAPAPAGRGTPAPAPAGRGTPAPALAGRGTPAPAPAGRGTPAPAPAGRGTPAPAPAGRGTPAPAPAGRGTPAPAPAGRGAPSGRRT